jgi:hypothetical protein
MTTVLTAGRLLITRPDGSTAFDTDQKMFSSVFVQGAIVVPQRATTNTYGTASYSNVDATYELGSVPAAMTDVIGMVRFTAALASQKQVHEQIWTQYNGLYMNTFWGAWTGSGGVKLLGTRYFRFEITNGALRCREKTRMTGLDDPNHIENWVHLPVIQGGTLHYKLFCGFFS